MPATTTPHKRDEVQGTDQSTSAKETKISKPEDRKGQANMSQNDAISSLEDHIRFNDDVMKKLRLLDKELSPVGGKSLQETLEMIESRNNQLKKEKESKTTNRLKSLLFELQCQIFEDLSDKDLINLMLSDSSYEDAASDVLCRRNISLSYLKIDYETETVLKVVTRRGPPSQYYELNVENAAAICEGYEENNGNNLTRAVYLLFSYYNCSEAGVTSNQYCSNEIPLTLEAFFGPAPSELGEKIKIRYLDMTSHTAPMLGWFRPKTLYVLDSPDWLIQTTKKELKELIAGIDQISFTCGYKGRVDKLMEACEAKDILIISSDAYWSDESILSVIKANVNCDSKVATRTIEVNDSGRSKTQWKELFASLTNSYQENPARGVRFTIGMPKCDVLVHGRFVQFFLY